ncbi:MAG: kynureninase [Burkholderiaceae bacterium]
MKSDSGPIARADAQALDAADPLADLREQFDLPPDVVYLDGNSLGALPRATAQRLHCVVAREWGEGLIRSWNVSEDAAGWIGLPQRTAAKLAPLIGAAAEDVLVGDSTSVNLYKVLAAALAIARCDATQRNVIVTERGNFPTDRYIAESLARQHGCELRSVDADGLAAALDEHVAVLLLTHVDYRNGRLHDMAALSAAAHAAGALAVWDLAHSAGAVPLHLPGDGADLAVGCGYKYLNGGPGAPAFLWTHPRHTARMDRDDLRQPLAGWFGHAAPFDFDPVYRPARGIARFACGTPAVLSMAALECGLDVFEVARPLGGIAALRVKSMALTSLFIDRVERRCAGLDLTLASPRDAAQRGSQASFAHADAYPVMQALIERGVIGDFRSGGLHDPDHLLRFGFTPLYTRYVDAWDAAETLAQVLESKAWQAARFSHRAAVT